MKFKPNHVSFCSKHVHDFAKRSFLLAIFYFLGIFISSFCCCTQFHFLLRHFLFACVTSSKWVGFFLSLAFATMSIAYSLNSILGFFSQCLLRFKYMHYKIQGVARRRGRLWENRKRKMMPRNGEKSIEQVQHGRLVWLLTCFYFLSSCYLSFVFSFPPILLSFCPLSSGFPSLPLSLNLSLSDPISFSLPVAFVLCLSISPFLFLPVSLLSLAPISPFLPLSFSDHIPYFPDRKYSFIFSILLLTCHYSFVSFHLLFFLSCFLRLFGCQWLLCSNRNDFASKAWNNL